MLRMPSPRVPAHDRAQPRSLADELRTWDDARLLALLAARPDLLAPAPGDLGTLAARATTRASVQRALDGLDTLALQLLDALTVQAEAATRARAARLLGLRTAELAEPLARLRTLALVWGPDTALRLVLTVRDALGPYPAGLGPPLEAAAAHLADPATIGELIERAPDGALTVLRRLVPGPPVGAVARADRPVDPGAARSPVEWLLAHRLLAVVDADHVALPREIGLHLRGGLVHADVSTLPPTATVDERDGTAVDAAAGAAAAELVRLVGELAEAWGTRPPNVLRSGGLGVRDLRRTAALLEVGEPVTALVAELAYQAGLIADDGEADPRWAPTPAYDVWAGEAGELRWAVLALAWLGGARVPGLVGSRDDKGAVRAALSSDVERAGAAAVRDDVLAGLNELGSRAAIDAGSLLARLRWRRPRRTGGLYADLVRWTLEEAELLGVTGRGAVSTPGRLLAKGQPTVGPPSAAALAAALRPLLPIPVDHVLLQADLTAVAPGPLEPEVARLMQLSADIESRGGATVYRFSPASVRRALDAGLDADGLVGELVRHSRTPVPQALEYLVRDVARRHGLVRVGGVSSYLRSDDPTLLRELLADRRTAALRLRALAPTVLASPADPATVLDVLRRAGLAPAAESALGELLVRRPDVRRSPARRPPPAARRVAPTPALLEAVLRGLRADVPPEGAAEASRATGMSRAARAAVPTTDLAVTLAALRDAVAGRHQVWIGYADAAGRVRRLAVQPLAVEDGRITAFDQAGEQIRTFSVHRVTGVALPPRSPIVVRTPIPPR